MHRATFDGRIAETQVTRIGGRDVLLALVKVLRVIRGDISAEAWVYTHLDSSCGVGRELEQARVAGRVLEFNTGQDFFSAQEPPPDLLHVGTCGLLASELDQPPTHRSPGYRPNPR